MNTRPNDLPDFKTPPLDEVALSVQFDAISKFQSPQIGLLWARFRDQFPKAEQHPPLESVVEKFGPAARPGVRLEVSSAPPVPRCWFLKEDGKELIQVQQDRFIHNWRKLDTDDSYPRYEHIRKQFIDELNEFLKFLKDENIGALSPNQCEVTYTNIISTSGGLITHGELGHIVTPVRDEYSDDYLPKPENVQLATQHVFYDKNKKPLGRLYISIQPAFRVSDNGAIFLLNLTARGAPSGKTIDDIITFMDMGREWIVRGFASVTTPEMHKIWGRKDEY